MADDNGYNGWTNYETWNVALHLDNDEGSYNYWREAAQESWDGADSDRSFTREERAAAILADRLKDEHEEAQPELSGVFSDLLSAAMSAVNWHEIANHYIDDVDKEEEEDEGEEEEE